MKTLLVACLMLSMPVGARCAETPYDKCQDAAAAIDAKMVECADQELSRVNGDLNRKYANVVALIKRDDVLASFREAERAWISYRDKSCGFERAYHGDASLTRFLYPNCLIGLTRSRVADMEAYLKDDELGAE